MSEKITESMKTANEIMDTTLFAAVSDLRKMTRAGTLRDPARQERRDRERCECLQDIIASAKQALDLMEKAHGWTPAVTPELVGANGKK